MSLGFIFLLPLLCLPAWVRAEDYSDVTVIVRGSETIASTSEEFVCATIDWWPPEKCNYDQCPWGSASVLNLVSSKIVFFFVMQHLVHQQRSNFVLFVNFPRT
jgi:heparanase 1